MLDPRAMKLQPYKGTQSKPSKGCEKSGHIYHMKIIFFCRKKPLYQKFCDMVFGGRKIKSCWYSSSRNRWEPARRIAHIPKIISCLTIWAHGNAVLCADCLVASCQFASFDMKFRIPLAPNQCKPILCTIAGHTIIKKTLETLCNFLQHSRKNFGVARIDRPWNCSDQEPG